MDKEVKIPMALVKSHARKLLAAELASWRGIPLEAADDLIDHIQELLYDYRGGMSGYSSEEHILTDFGVPYEFKWVFD